MRLKKPVIALGSVMVVPFLICGTVSAQSKSTMEDIFRNYEILDPTPAQKKVFANYEAEMKKMLTPQLKAACVDDFKHKAHDPSSFQIAGEWGLDILNQMSVASGDEKEQISVPIRARNGYGGLVRARLHCYYQRLSGNKLSFLFSLTE